MVDFFDRADLFAARADDLPEVEVGVALQDEEFVDPERFYDEGTLDNGVRIFEQRWPRYSTAPKYPKLVGYLSDFYARCPICGWTDHHPTLPVIRRHAKQHPCQFAAPPDDEGKP